MLDYPFKRYDFWKINFYYINRNFTHCPPLCNMCGQPEDTRIGAFRAFFQVSALLEKNLNLSHYRLMWRKKVNNNLKFKTIITGELALSCNPSYMGGKSCGMARNVNTSVAHQMYCRVRTVAANVRQVAQTLNLKSDDEKCLSTHLTFSTLVGGLSSRRQHCDQHSQTQLYIL
jgi:hypothetical protein